MMKDIEPPTGKSVEPEKKYKNPTGYIQYLREHEPYSGYYDEMAERESLKLSHRGLKTIASFFASE